MSSLVTIITSFLETEPHYSWVQVDWPANPRVPPVSIQHWGYPHVLYLGFGWLWGEGWLGLGFVSVLVGLFIGVFCFCLCSVWVTETLSHLPASQSKH